MDVWIFPTCFGVFSLIFGVYCRIFQARSNVVWSDADAACRHSSGTLFKPDETSFDVFLFPHKMFDGDSWAAVTYTFVPDPETYFRRYQLNNSYRCIAVEIQQSCAVQYWHKACTEGYGMIYESQDDLQRLYQSQIDWKTASDLCQRHDVKLAMFINTGILFSRGPCHYGFYWTGRVIQVMFQSIRSNNGLDTCGILQNHVLSFDNCFRMLSPLCEIAEQTTTRSPHPYYSTGTTIISSVLKNSTTASRTIKTMPTISVQTSTTIKQFATFEVTSQWSNTTNLSTGGIKEENITSSLPAGTNIERGIGATSSFDGKSNSPDIGVIIGSVLGGIVFLLLMVLLIILLLKRLSQGTGKSDSTKQTEKTKSLRQNKSLNATYSVDNQAVVLQSGIINAEYISYTSHRDQFNGVIMEEISKPNNSTYSLVCSEANFANYATVKTKAVRKASNGSTDVIYEINDQLDDQKEMGGENVTGNVYDKANFPLRDGLMSQSDSIYDTTNECSNTVGQSDGVYDKANNGHFGEYDTTYVTKRDTDFTYDHM